MYVQTAENFRRRQRVLWLWVKSLVPPGKPPGQYKIVIRTRYQRYIGAFVLHCHILDHEDQGMMQNISVRCRTARSA